MNPIVSSDSTSHYEYYTFQSSATTYEEMASISIDWEDMFEIGYPMRLYLPPLVNNQVAPFVQKQRQKQFTGYKFKIGGSKK